MATKTAPSAAPCTLAEAFAILKREVRRAGIPVGKDMSTRVRGYRKVTQAGVCLHLGEEWERPAYVDRERSKLRKLKRPYEHLKAEPSKILVDVYVHEAWTEAERKRREQQAAELLARVHAVATTIGLVPQGIHLVLPPAAPPAKDPS